MEPLPLTAGRHRVGAFTYELERDGGDGWWLGQHEHGSSPGFRFGDRRASLADFAPHHERLSTSPESGFVRTLMVQRPAADRIVSLRARTRFVDGPGLREREVVGDVDAFAGALEGFGIELDALGPERLERLWARAVAQHEAHRRGRGRGAAGAVRAQYCWSMAFVPPARHLTRAKDLADARYAEPLTVDDLAAAAGLTRAHFSREFRRAFGEPPHAYLLTRRLERAAALLRNTDRSVTEICFGRAAQPRLVHHQLHPHLRRLAHRLPRGPPAGRRAGAGPAASSAPTPARNTARLEKSGAQTATSLDASTPTRSKESR